MTAPKRVIHDDGLCGPTHVCNHACRKVSPDEVTACRVWLRANAQRRGAFNTCRRSSAFAEDVRKSDGREAIWGQSIENGAFIEAARLERYRIMGIGDRDAYFNIQLLCRYCRGSATEHNTVCTRCAAKLKEVRKRILTEESLAKRGVVESGKRAREWPRSVVDDPSLLDDIWTAKHHRQRAGGSRT